MLAFDKEIVKHDSVFIYNEDVTNHLNRVFNGLLKAVYVHKAPDKYDPIPRFSDNGEELCLDGCVIWLLFINNAWVRFSNSEWGSLSNQ